MAAAPPVVQDAVTSPTTQQVIDELGKQYILHVDVIGLLVKLTTYMLLGYVRPEESLQELRAAGITDQQARQIIDEINKKIFIPLLEKMRTETGAQPVAPKPVMSAQQKPQPITPTAPTPPISPPPGAPVPSRFFHLDNRLPPRPLNSAPTGSSDRSVPQNGLAAQTSVAAAALSTPVPPPTQQPPKPISASPTPFPQPPRPSVASGVGGPRPVSVQPPAQAKTVDILNTEPKPQQPLPIRPPVSNIAPLPPKIVLPRPAATIMPRPVLPVSEKPAVQPVNTPPRPLAPPPPNLPGAMPPTDILPPSRPAPIASKVPQAPVKPYSSDPYREPIE